MAYIPSILRKYCPNGVEFKTLGEITAIKTSSTGAGRDLIDSGDSPAVFIDDIFKNVFLKKSVSFINEDLITGNKVYCYFGDVILVSRGFYSEDLLKACAYLGNEKILVGNDICILKHWQNPLYLAFALSLKSVEEQKLITGTVAIGITTKNIKKIKIPLPPLEIQNKISNILRQLWEKKEELKEFLKREAQERENQFDIYFMESFKNIREVKTIKEISTEIKNTSGNTVSDFLITLGNAPIVTFNDIKNNFFLDKPNHFVKEEYIRRKIDCCFGDLLIVSRGNFYDVGKACAYLGKENSFVSNGALILKHSQNPVYLAFAFSFVFRFLRKGVIAGSIMGHITKERLEQIKIPIPNIEKQNRISRLLKNFWIKKEELIKQLEREFYLREKQFELIKESLFYTSEQP